MKEQTLETLKEEIDILSNALETAENTAETAIQLALLASAAAVSALLLTSATNFVDLYETELEKRLPIKTEIGLRSILYLGKTADYETKEKFVEIMKAAGLTKKRWMRKYINACTKEKLF